MNTDSQTVKYQLFRNIMGRAAALSLVACLGVVASPATGNAMESIAALNGIAPMNASELQDSYGGFALPDGVNINIGIETDISINGNLVVRNYYTSGKFESPQGNNRATPTTSLNIEQIGSTTKIYQPAASTPPQSSGDSQSVSLQDGNTIVTYNADPLTGIPQTIISNSANNAVISQVQKITIDITNYASALQLQASSALATLRAQATSSIVNAMR